MRPVINFSFIKLSNSRDTVPDGTAFPIAQDRPPCPRYDHCLTAEIAHSVLLSAKNLFLCYDKYTCFIRTSQP